jgi:hypothetical protein
MKFFCRSRSPIYDRISSGKNGARHAMPSRGRSKSRSIASSSSPPPHHQNRKSKTNGHNESNGGYSSGRSTKNTTRSSSSGRIGGGHSPDSFRGDERENRRRRY